GIERRDPGEDEARDRRPEKAELAASIDLPGGKESAVDGRDRRTGREDIAPGSRDERKDSEPEAHERKRADRRHDGRNHHRDAATPERDGHPGMKREDPHPRRAGQ